MSEKATSRIPSLTRKRTAARTQQKEIKPEEDVKRAKIVPTSNFTGSTISSRGRKVVSANHTKNDSKVKSNVLKNARPNVAKVGQNSTSTKSANVMTTSKMDAIMKTSSYTGRPTMSFMSKVKNKKNNVTPASSKVQSNTGDGGDGLLPPKKPKRKAWDVKGQLEDARLDLDFYRTQCSTLHSDLSQIEAFKSRITELESNCDQLTKTSVTDKNQIEMDKKKIVEMTNELTEVNKQLSESQMSCEQLEVRCKKLQSRNELLEVVEEEKKLVDEKNRELQEKLTNTLQDLDENRKKLISGESERRELLETIQQLKGNIRVYCRVRPLIPQEDDDDDAIDHLQFPDQKSLEISEKGKSHPFAFDRVYDTSATQLDVFSDVSQVIQSFLDGYNVCIFAYGQTGAGKTYTMEGPESMKEHEIGIIPRAMQLMFQKSEELKHLGWEYTFSVQQVQIYCETLMDLLPSDLDSKLEIKTTTDDGNNKIWVKNLSKHHVSCFDQVMELLQYSKQKRITASTNANERSSRSHSVFILSIVGKNLETGKTTSSDLNLVDLAGSERLSVVDSKGTRLKETQKINSSLSELSHVITSLAKKKSHVPYRNSKLTFLLKDSLGGNSKTMMLVNINPSKQAIAETINTLRFATTTNACNIGTAQQQVKL